MSFGPWLNICFLSIGDMQTQNKLLHWSQEVSFRADQSFKPGSWQKPQEQKLWRLLCRKFPFHRDFCPSSCGWLGSLGLVSLQVCENAKALCCFLQFSLYALGCELKNALRGKVEGVGLSNLIMLLSLLGIGRTSFGCFGSCLLTSNNCVLYNTLLL